MTKQSQPAIGIDLGTTYSVIARINESNRPESMPNAEGELLTPSVVLFDGDDIIIGKEAFKARTTELERVADCPKRQMGSRVYDRMIDNRHYPPEVLQGWILNKLKKDAERVAGDFDKAVITVPAYFDEVRRKATQDSGYVAGLQVLDIINEPTAAAIAYGYQAGWIDRDGKSKAHVKFLVYDLGGGTFDVTVMEVRDNIFRTIATDGDVRLGGCDWDQQLIDYVAEKFQVVHGVDPREDPQALGRLLRDCQEAKETLSVRNQVTIDCNFENKSIQVEMNREQFEMLTQSLLDRTDFTIRKTLQAAEMLWSDIDHILLVGGSTRMPAVRKLLRKLSGKEPDVSLSPDEAVAHGAAIRCAMLLGDESGNVFAKTEIKNVNSHTLGVVANEVGTGIQQVVPVIPRNTPLPVTAKRVFKTHSSDKESILVKIVEGESSKPDGCVLIGRCSIWDIPTAMPVGTPIEVIFNYSHNGRLDIEVKIGEKKGQRKTFRYQLERPNSLTQEQLDQWRKHICG